MKILVIGAAGKTGRLVVERALAAGHAVNAFVHHAAKDGEEKLPASVTVFTGDVNNPLSLKEAMTGCKAVIDTIGGTTPFLDTSLESAAARVVLEVMPAVGARRLIVISALGVGEGGAHGDFFYEHLLLPIFLRGSSKDKAAMEAEVAHSAVDWTIIRPPVLSDSNATGQVHVVPDGATAHKISRADLAHWIVENLERDTYVGRAVTIANR